MTQPKIISEQIDNDSLFPVGSGHQIQSVFGVIDPSTGTSQIPFDNTVPLITEGTEIGSAPFTRNHSTSSVLIQFNVTVDCDTPATTIILAVFRNDTCIGSVIVELDAGDPNTVSMTHVDPISVGGSPDHGIPPIGSPATEIITYSGRIGTAAGTETWYVNSTDSGNDLGGSLHSSFVLTELK